MRISVIVVLIVFAAVRCTSDEDRQGTGRLDSISTRELVRHDDLLFSVATGHSGKWHF